ncbi:MAG: right-handed parallel beta-helix repeat-containing protein [Candidatus Marinimicrobia bacterium]|nr:right-handed parallel beta-helix repeat-containing protein [Candidatus Neomarinimicrobiota bacterium]
MRLKNLVNYPVIITSFKALDTLGIQPDRVKFLGTENTSYINFTDDIRIQGRQDNRPTWIGGDQGSFGVSENAEVRILDFNFQGSSDTTALIRVQSGKLVLENCDFRNVNNWGIIIEAAGTLELRNVRFTGLQKGAINQVGGTVKIHDCYFDMAGETAVMASAGEIFEAHKVTFTNTMGTAIELHQVAEVWLDSVSVLDSFKDGISLSDCEFTLLDHVVSHKNGRNGLIQNNTILSGLINYSAVGNLLNGIQIQDVDTLRILNSEFVGNGDNGADLREIRKSRMAGLVFGHNTNEGLRITNGEEFFINHSTSQANLRTAMNLDSLLNVNIMNTSVVNNRNGLSIGHFGEIKLQGNLFKSNADIACQMKVGNKIDFVSNEISENQIGLIAEDVSELHLDSNMVTANDSGTEFRSIERIFSRSNILDMNKSASYFSEVGFVRSEYDTWKKNSLHALEVLSATDFNLSNANIAGNADALLLNQVSVKIENSEIDSSTGYAIKLMNGNIFIHETKFRSGETGIVVKDGSRAKITQSQFSGFELAVDAAASSNLVLSYSSLSYNYNGVRIGNYGKTELIANRFDQIGNYCVESMGPHLQSLYMRQNILSNSGGALKSTSYSGKIDLISNTFAMNELGVSLVEGTIERLDHNIFYHTDISGPIAVKDTKSIKWNCFYPDIIYYKNATASETNIHIDPVFDEKYFLTKESKCLHGGENGIHIGALGTIQTIPQTLMP